MEAIQHINQYITQIVQDTDIFLVDLSIKPTNNIKVFLDADDGFSITKSVSVNRQLRKLIDESGLYPEGEYSLEVSSPGIDESLKFKRQYVKNIGRKLLVEQDNNLELIGELKEVTEDYIVIEEPAVKHKKEAILHTISFESIKKAIVQISF
jgi:ribosome maturation factor RimP